jgi:hypothetical protein
MRRNRLIRFNLPVVRILRNASNDWNKITRGVSRTATERKLSVDWSSYSQDKYLFSHCSIVSSVEVEDDGHTIKAPCDELVNSNGNAWTTPVLMATFRSFINKPNYLEHVQIPALSKGMILDAVSRPVVYTGNDGRSKANVVYVDILVATDRKHADLCDRIERGELSTMSMGCLAHHVVCSRCGKEIDDSMKNCEHLDNELLTYYTDKNGQKHITAELCGRMTKNTAGEWEADPESLEFIEASWVEKPAFKGAVLNHFVSQVDKKVASVLEFPAHMLQAAVDDMFHMRVADKEGMATIRVACAELRRIARRDTVENVAKSFAV